MTQALIVLLTALLGGFFYRARGGFNPLPFGTFGARFFFWALPNGAAVFVVTRMHGASLWVAVSLGLLCAVYAYVSLLEDQSSAIDNDNPLEDALQMAQIGAMRAAGIALCACYFAPALTLLPFFGALAGLAYWSGWHFLDGKDSGIHWWGRVFARGGSEWGEILTGMAMGLGVGLLGFVL